MTSQIVPVVTIMVTIVENTILSNTVRASGI